MVAMEINKSDLSKLASYLLEDWRLFDDSLNQKILILGSYSAQNRCRGGATNRALDLRSTGRGFKSTRGKSCVTTLGKLLARASVTKRYNLVPVKGRWCSAAGKVTTSLAESNGSLPPGGWPGDPIRSQRSVTSMGSLYSLLFAAIWTCTFEHVTGVRFLQPPRIISTTAVNSISANILNVFQQYEYSLVA